MVTMYSVEDNFYSSQESGQDGLIIGKDAKAMQNVFKQVAGQDNVMSAKSI